jgi:hypothetical protein
MPFLSGILRIFDSLGNRVDRPTAQGQQQAVELMLGAGIESNSEDRGDGFTRVTINAVGGATGPTGPGGDTGPAGPAGAGYSATSVTTIALTTGTKVFGTQSGLAYVEGAPIRAISVADPSSYLEGTVASYTSGPGGNFLTVDATRVVGSGSRNSWSFSLTGATGATGPRSRRTGVFRSGMQGIRGTSGRSKRDAAVTRAGTIRAAI